MSGVPLVVLLWQSVFNFPNWLFHECLIKNQENHNLSFVKRKMQGSEWRLQHTRCFAKEILQVSPQYSVFLTSAFPWLLIPYSTSARTYFVSRRQVSRQFNKLWVILKNVGKIQETVYDKKKIDIFCSDNSSFELYWRRLIKNCPAKRYLAINFKYLAEQCKFTPHFVWSVCPHCQLEFVL